MGGLVGNCAWGTITQPIVETVIFLVLSKPCQTLEFQRKYQVSSNWNKRVRT